MDVGDLDRVIQIDAPFTVASFLQRLGRSGRREGAVRSCLFLTLGDEALLRASGLLHLWRGGFVEPVRPPERPLQIIAQQALALVLQEGRVGRRELGEWQEVLRRLATADECSAVVQHMIQRGLLFEDHGLLSVGGAGEAGYGWRHFSDPTSVFTSDPSLQVRWAGEVLGSIHPATLAVRRDGPRVLLLGGRRWKVRSVDWDRSRVYVEPGRRGGRSRWRGEARDLSFALCRAMRSVVSGEVDPPGVGRRALERLEEIRELHRWVPREGTVVVTAEGRTRWWTFAGSAANRLLAGALGDAADPAETDNITLTLTAPESGASLRARLEEGWSTAAPAPQAVAELVKALKFSDCLPAPLAAEVVIARAVDREGAATVRGEAVTLAGW